MTTPAPLNMGEQFEKCLAIIRQASVEILLLLNVHFEEGKDPRWFLEQLDVARLSMGGWGAVAKRLKLSDAELTQFTLQLRHLQQLVPRYENGQNVSENQLIAALRFIGALENLRKKQKLLSYNTALNADNTQQQQQGQQQLRALESLIKSLVMQAWSDPERLRDHLKTQFGGDRVRRWLRLGDRNDVLSGMRFSELALLLVDKKEFSQHYARLFNDASVLNLFVEPRKTLQTFLDDVREMRTCVVAGQPLTSNQLLMLANYYPQITGPVQRAYEEKRSKINPTGLLKEAGEGLEAFWEQARKKDRAAGGDAQPIRDSIDTPAKRPVRSREEREQMISGVLWGAVGVVALIIAIGTFWLFVGGSAPVTRGARVTGPITDQRVAPSPKEELSRMGLGQDENNFRSAINRNDTRVVSLFLRTGMNWKLSWTEQAVIADYNDVLDLLLRYRLQMDEKRPCRRFIATLTHEMAANNKKLTSITKSYLQAFCTTPAVVDRARYEMEQAQLRYDANPSDENRKWADIYSAVYNAID
ncbi:STY4199 family HEPN domain-containing protein [Kosakonia sp. H02]|nr:STY4199 family HEPN domain-containing protein [Kosakonia sp. H02]